jgi:hypothetical protein
VTITAPPDRQRHPPILFPVADVLKHIKVYNGTQIKSKSRIKQFMVYFLQVKSTGYLTLWTRQERNPNNLEADSKIFSLAAGVGYR